MVKVNSILIRILVLEIIVSLTSAAGTLSVKLNRLQNNNSKFLIRDFAQKQSSVSLNNYLNDQYTGTMLIGSHKEPFKMLFDTASPWLWVIGSNPNASSLGKIFNCTESSTCKLETQSKGSYLNGSYFSFSHNQNIEGIVAWDELAFDITTPYNQSFLIIQDVKVDIASDSYFDGICGLGPNSDKDNSTLLDNLYKTHTIDQRIFSLYLDNNPESFNEDSSELLFGGIDPQYSLNEFVGIPALLNLHYWELIFNPILLLNNGGSTDTIKLDATSAILDSGLSFILMTTDDLSKFRDSLRSNFSLSCSYDVNHNYGCECPDGNIDLFPQLTFAFGTTTLTLSPSYYLRVEEQTCILLILDGVTQNPVDDLGKSTNSSNNQPESKKIPSSYIVLGTPFLRAFYTVFDRDQNQVSFAKVHSPTVKKLTALEIIYLTFGIFIIILFTLLLIWIARLWFQKDKSSRKESKLFENTSTVKESSEPLQTKLIAQSIEKN